MFLCVFMCVQLGPSECKQSDLAARVKYTHFYMCVNLCVNLCVYTNVCVCVCICVCVCVCVCTQAPLNARKAIYFLVPYT